MAEEVREEVDPPPSPHDWRYVVRTVGKVFIATGLLLGGFVAYQLWGTGIEARRAQNELEDEFDALLASATTTPSTTSIAVTPSSTVLRDTATSEIGPGNTVPDTAPPDTVPETVPDTVPDTVPIAEGDPIARLEIPAIGVDKVVVAGVSVDDLKRGPGHYPDTPLPGQLGNAAIAGHRTTYGQPFHNVDALDVGDEIIVVTLAGRFVYDVTGIEIVENDDTHVVATTDFSVAQLTLTSCHPKWSARQRIIVHSLLDADQSAPVGDPTFGYDDGTAPATASSTTPSTTAASTASTISSTTATNTSPATTIASPTTSGQPSEGPTLATPSADAFSDGWFHDPSAIPQVLLWALLVAAIAIGAHVFGRRIRSRLIGIAVGTLPFLIALYFFYQNVNRLLPPSL